MAADKTTTKVKATKKAAKPAVEVKSVADLHADLATKKADQLELKRGHRAGELVNPRTLTHTRKEIARIKTAIRAAELKGDN